MTIVNELNKESLIGLISGEIGAIVLNHVLTEQQSGRACEVLRALTTTTTYTWKDDLRVLGVSIGEAHESATKLEQYLAGADETMRTVRHVVFDGFTPVDRISQQLLRVWEPGLRLAARNGRPFLQQILRRWLQGGGAHPHLDQSNTPLLAPFGLTKRIGLNVYLDMPSAGGAIEFWNREFSDAEYARSKRPDYGLDRQLLGAPDLTIRPQVGQAILFDASRPHAVEALAGVGERITNASFFSYSRIDEPLLTFA